MGAIAGDDNGKSLTTENIAYGAVAAGAFVVGGSFVAGAFIVSAALQTSSDTPTNDPKDLASRQNTAAVGATLALVSGGGGLRAGTPVEAPLPPPSLATQLDRIQAATENLVTRLESGPAATAGVLPATEANAELRSLSNPDAPPNAPGGSPTVEARSPTVEEGVEVADAIAHELRGVEAAKTGGGRNRAAAVVGRYDPTTQEAGAFASRPGRHAEGVAKDSMPDGHFSKPIDVRKGNYKNVCAPCAREHGTSAFPNGTKFD